MGGWTGRWIDGRTNRQTDNLTDRLTDSLAGGQAGMQTDRQLERDRGRFIKTNLKLSGFDSASRYPHHSLHPLPPGGKTVGGPLQVGQCAKVRGL
jgi:hypothetical protein